MWQKTNNANKDFFQQKMSGGQRAMKDKALLSLLSRDVDDGWAGAYR
jgi:hypothetical protein